MTIHTQAPRNGVGTLNQATSEDEVMSLAQFGSVTTQQDCILPLHDNNEFIYASVLTLLLSMSHMLIKGSDTMEQFHS
jgi:hypothetical protein